ncbi:TPA: hypothetical protein TT573_001933 [Streptococcus equi subsp. zooepidemicus]|nr:hypothetical protein [Streptococcus equi subsp. zooepidemicus]
MIIFLPADSVLLDNTLVAQNEEIEPVLYTLDELKKQMNDSLEVHKILKIHGYSEKSAPLYLGYLKRNKKGRNEVLNELEAMKRYGFSGNISSAKHLGG